MSFDPLSGLGVQHAIDSAIHAYPRSRLGAKIFDATSGLGCIPEMGKGLR